MPAELVLVFEGDVLERARVDRPPCADAFVESFDGEVPHQQRPDFIGMAQVESNTALPVARDDPYVANRPLIAGVELDADGSRVVASSVNGEIPDRVAKSLSGATACPDHSLRGVLHAIESGCSIGHPDCRQVASLALQDGSFLPGARVGPIRPSQGIGDDVFAGRQIDDPIAVGMLVECGLDCRRVIFGIIGNRTEIDDIQHTAIRWKPYPLSRLQCCG